nr:hypothetical protein [Tanacetum cinerariifolium]
MHTLRVKCRHGASFDFVPPMDCGDGEFDVKVLGGGEAILYVLNRLIENRRGDVGLSMLLVDLINAFNMVIREVMLHEVRICFLAISRWVEFCNSNPTMWNTPQGLTRAWYLDGDAISRDTLVVREDLKENNEGCTSFAGVFPPNIARPLHGVKLLGGAVSADFDFSSELVMKRVAKSIELMDVVAKINDPRCELMLPRACACISKLYFDMRTCSP